MVGQDQRILDRRLRLNLTAQRVERAELAGRGVDISDVQQMGPEGTPGSRYCFFSDPDGNMWAIQEYKRP